MTSKEKKAILSSSESSSTSSSSSSSSSSKTPKTAKKRLSHSHSKSNSRVPVMEDVDADADVHHHHHHQSTTNGIIESSSNFQSPMVSTIKNKQQENKSDDYHANGESVLVHLQNHKSPLQYNNNNNDKNENGLLSSSSSTVTFTPATSAAIEKDEVTTRNDYDTENMVQSMDKMYERLKNRQYAADAESAENIVSKHDSSTTFQNNNHDEKSHSIMITKDEIQDIVDEAVETLRDDTDLAIQKLHCEFLRQLQLQSDEHKALLEKQKEEIGQLLKENASLKVQNENLRLI